MEHLRKVRDRFLPGIPESYHRSPPDCRLLVVQGGEQRLEHAVARTGDGAGDGCLQGGACAEDDGEEQGNGGDAGRDEALRHPVTRCRASALERIEKRRYGGDAEGSERSRRVGTGAGVFRREGSGEAGIISLLLQPLNVRSKPVKECHVAVSLEMVS